MQHLDDITAVARIAIEERERKAARRRLAHEAMAGRPSTLRRMATIAKRIIASPRRGRAPEPAHSFDVAPDRR